VLNVVHLRDRYTLLDHHEEPEPARVRLQVKDPPPARPQVAAFPELPHRRANGARSEAVPSPHAKILAAWLLERHGIRNAERLVRNQDTFRLIAECDGSDALVRLQRALILGPAPRVNRDLYLANVVRRGYLDFDAPGPAWRC
jgi:hypothetical protein